MRLEVRMVMLGSFLPFLANQSGRNAKVEELRKFKELYPELVDDLVVIQECLDGKHMLGYTYPEVQGSGDPAASTLRGVIEILEQPIKGKDLSQRNIDATVATTSAYGEILRPIVNRTLRLGIRLAEDERNFAPMLACKFEDCYDNNVQYIVQDKLDGNRCIAIFNKEEDEWEFISRNGKPLKVKFNMGCISTGYVYDGEMLTKEQTAATIRRDKLLPFTEEAGALQKLSGKVNSHREEDKQDLIYNIYDVMIDLPCRARQDVISWQREYATENVRFVNNLDEKRTKSIKELLDYVTSTGGEGLILRDPSAPYVHDRTPALLKVKKMQSMDMLCIGTEKGTGRNAERIGKLVCTLTKDDGTYIEAKVGSGLSDFDRNCSPESFIGQIIEVQYFETTKAEGRKGLSLKYPVYLGIRNDKATTSEH